MTQESGPPAPALRDQLRNGGLRLAVVLGTVLGALLGTGGTIGLQRYVNPALLREDPFTGADWTAQSGKLRKEVGQVEKHIGQVWTALSLLEQRVVFAETTFIKHEEELKLELRELRSLLGEVNGQLKAISAGVASLPPPEWRRRIEALEDDRIRKDPDYRKPR